MVGKDNSGPTTDIGAHAKVLCPVNDRRDRFIGADTGGIGTKNIEYRFRPGSAKTGIGQFLHVVFAIIVVGVIAQFHESQNIGTALSCGNIGLVVDEIQIGNIFPKGSISRPGIPITVESSFAIGGGTGLIVGFLHHTFVGGGIYGFPYLDIKENILSSIAFGYGCHHGDHGSFFAKGGTGHFTIIGDHIGIRGFPGDGGTVCPFGGQGFCGDISEIFRIKSQGCGIFPYIVTAGNRGSRNENIKSLGKSFSL